MDEDQKLVWAIATDRKTLQTPCDRHVLKIATILITRAFERARAPSRSYSLPLVEGLAVEVDDNQFLDRPQRSRNSLVTSRSGSVRIQESVV